jgi:dihydropteroate synthase
MRARGIDRVLRRAARMMAGGAAIIDVGGESTRPGAARVGEQEEIDRVLPVVAALLARFDAVVSVDTSSPRLIREAAALGAGMVNDVRALGVKGAMAAVRDAGMAVCLMHMQGDPGTMQDEPRYDDVCAEVRAFLLARAAACEDLGIARERHRDRPGLRLRQEPRAQSGAGALSAGAGALRLPAAGRHVAQVDDRAELPDVRCADACREGLRWLHLPRMRGARIVRSHDVAATCDALKVVAAVDQGVVVG